MNVVKCRWGSQGAVSSATDSWQSLGEGSWGTASERYLEGKWIAYKRRKLVSLYILDVTSAPEYFKSIILNNFMKTEFEHSVGRLSFYSV